MENLTFAMENYLEAVYELSSEGTGARVTDIAIRMGVTKASANNAMNTLASKGLIENERYHEIVLTREGKKRAAFISSKHVIIQRFLITVLSVDEKIADTDACAIEHVISRDVVDAMHLFLKKYKK